MVNKLRKIRKLICKLIELYQNELSIIKENFLNSPVESKVEAHCEDEEAKTKRREYFKQYHAKHKDKRKTYYEQNKTKLKEMHKNIMNKTKQK
ncbi:MAG: hypothetical protein RLY15_1242 [Bacteroidota bacterium]